MRPSDRHRAHFARQDVDAGRQHHSAECRIEGLPKRVVEIANAFASRFVNERHVLLHAIDAPSWRAERRGGTLSIIIRGVEVVAVYGGGQEFVLSEGVDKLGEFLRRERRAFVRGIGGRSGCLGGLSGFGCHASIIAPDRRARLRLSHSWSFMGQSGSLTPDVSSPGSLAIWEVSYRRSRCPVGVITVVRRSDMYSEEHDLNAGTRSPLRCSQRRNTTSSNGGRAQARATLTIEDNIRRKILDLVERSPRLLALMTSPAIFTMWRDVKVGLQRR